MKRIFICLMLLAGPLWSDVALDTQMAELQKKYQSIESLRADFSQSYLSKRFSENITEKGVVYFRKGGLMRWEYQHPEKKIFTSDGVYFFYYVPADKQVIKMPVDKSDHSPTLFLAGEGNFLSDFRAQWADPRPGSNLVKLLPLRNRSDFQYLIAEIDPVRDLIVRLLVVDSYENRTEYRFEKILENPSISPNLFHFVPPPGTDLIFQQEQEE